jgi:hypothetical protein
MGCEVESACGADRVMATGTLTILIVMHSRVAVVVALNNVRMWFLLKAMLPMRMMMERVMIRLITITLIRQEMLMSTQYQWWVCLLLNPLEAESNIADNNKEPDDSDVDRVGSKCP